MRPKSKSIFSVLLISIPLLLASCMASHSGLLLNETSVQLNQNNFSYIATNQSGEAKVTYWLGIGGMAKQSLIFEAVKDLNDKRKLEQGQAWVNQTVTFKTTRKLGIFVTTTCMVSADIIQFK